MLLSSMKAFGIILIWMITKLLHRTLGFLCTAALKSPSNYRNVLTTVLVKPKNTT